LSDWFFKQNARGRLWRRLGIIDSWLDSSLAGLWQGLQDRWNAGSSFFARFRLTGWRRLLNEVLSEGLTLGVGGLALMYVLALPAFQEMDESKILGTGKYSVRFIDQNGKEIGQRGILHNDAVPLSEIPDHLIKATLATEDRRFFDHFGVDVFGTLRALATNLNAGETVQGGSTLTQQLAKNLFLSSERSLTRKIKELFLSFWLEAHFTKRQILKLYFDRAYMGGGAFGVEAAAQLYFGKSVRDVTLAEAAMMAGLFKAPTRYGPHIDLPAARARANEVLSNLVEAGFMTAGQVQNARLHPAQPIESRLANSPDWYLDWAFEEVQRIAEGRGSYVLTARVTVDLRLQQAAEQALISPRSARVTDVAEVLLPARVVRVHVAVDLLEVVLDLLDHFDHAPQRQIAGQRIELGADVVLRAIAVARRLLDRFLHRLDDDRLVDHLLGRHRGRDREQFGAVGEQFFHVRTGEPDDHFRILDFGVRIFAVGDLKRQLEARARQHGPQEGFNSRSNGLGGVLRSAHDLCPGGFLSLALGYRGRNGGRRAQPVEKPLLGDAHHVSGQPV
jgi:hypothetical protein